MSNLYTKGLLGIISLFVAMSLLIFVPAGTTFYWQAWVFLAVWFGASSVIVIYLIMTKNRALLERRMRGGPVAEKEKAQRIIMSLLSLDFIALLVVPALDHRMHWSHVAIPVVILGDVLIAGTWGCWFFVLRENPFAASTVEIASDQKVISTGPYAVVRHPMYASGLLIFFGMPLALGSYWGLLGGVAMIPVLLWRTLDEERVLYKGLPEYEEYAAKVYWRWIPGIF
jgi:protein-S-isoprenylcysteine O-methyltransferase Ste14